MDYDRYTTKTQEVLQAATTLARQGDHGQIDTDHILAALLDQEDGVVAPLLTRLEVDVRDLSASARALIAKKPKVFGEAAQVYLSPAASKAFAKAEGEAKALKDDYVATEHLLLALMGDEGPVGTLLRDRGIVKTAEIGRASCRERV